MDANGTCSQTSLQNVKALWETPSISFTRLRNDREKVQSGTFRLATGPYFQISSPVLRLIGLLRIIKFQATNLAVVKGFASL